MVQTHSTIFPLLIIHCYKAIEGKETWALGVSTHFPDCSHVPLRTGPDFDYVPKSPTVSGGPGQTPKHAQITAAWMHEENLVKGAVGCHCSLQCCLLLRESCREQMQKSCLDSAFTKTLSWGLKCQTMRELKPRC